MCGYMNYPTSYKYAARKKPLEQFKQKVVCVLQARKQGMSFQHIADTCKISDRQTAFKIYQANKSDPELKGLSNTL